MRVSGTGWPVPAFSYVKGTRCGQLVTGEKLAPFKEAQAASESAKGLGRVKTLLHDADQRG
jgi:hypothetical protein